MIKQRRSEFLFPEHNICLEKFVYSFPFALSAVPNRNSTSPAKKTFRNRKTSFLECTILNQANYRKSASIHGCFTTSHLTLPYPSGCLTPSPISHLMVFHGDLML